MSYESHRHRHEHHRHRHDPHDSSRPAVPNRDNLADRRGLTLVQPSWKLRCGLAPYSAATLMYHYPADIYTEPEPDTNTLANLGPLTGMAGIWTGADGMDVNPKPAGPEHQPFIERYELQPLDAQTNGPQLFYGLRYHTRIVKPEDPETFHDQVGYWLWEPATDTILLSLSIPRGQTAMAVGRATRDTKSFTLEARRGSLTNGILSNPFLEQAFRTERYTIKVDIHTDGTWSYEQDTLLIIPGQQEPFHHTDRNRLRKIAEPTPNPTALAARGATQAS